MKIQLYCPKSVIGKGANDGLYWPSGLLNIATYLKHRDSSIEVELFDGELYSDVNSLEKSIDPESRLIGISNNTFNYENCLKLARNAKSKSIPVVLGGPHATRFPELILQKRPEVTAVIVGKGERALFDYLIKPPSEVPNLVWRDDKGDIHRNKRKDELSLDELPLPNHSLLDLDAYQRNHELFYPDFPDKPMSILTHEGCVKRKECGKCTFCSINTPVYFRNPSGIWEEIKEGYSKYGFNFVKDWGDSLTGNPGFLERLVKMKPSELDVSFSIYCNTSDINKHSIELLSHLPVKMVFGGFESGNDQILTNMNKHTTVSTNLEAAKLFGEKGLVIFASYVLGGKGETVGTLEDTLDFAREITNLADVRVSNASPLVPLPGAPDFSNLMKATSRFRGKDLLDIIELKEEWVRNFCPELPNYEILEEYSFKIGELSPLKNAFGWNRSKYEK
jgi:radical SAM superfamily enzyme YgiQ (UPF0313 family)